ncbi:hypothetical protein HDU86_005960 [Geranomyces michiganensis]|nr:hypothetical protein HDU86_005960 [Geranomyces michiganensis]
MLDHPPAALLDIAAAPHASRRSKPDMRKRLSRAQAMAQRELKLLASVQSPRASTSRTTDRVVRAVTKKLQASLNGGFGEAEKKERDGSRRGPERPPEAADGASKERPFAATEESGKDREIEALLEGCSKEQLLEPAHGSSGKEFADPKHPTHRALTPDTAPDPLTTPAWVSSPPDSGAKVALSPPRPSAADQHVRRSPQPSPPVHQVEERWASPPPPAAMIDKSLQVDRSASSFSSDKPQPPVPRVVIPRVRVESARSARPQTVTARSTRTVEKHSDISPPDDLQPHARTASRQRGEQSSEEPRFAQRVAYPPAKSDSFVAPQRPSNKRAPFSVTPPPAESHATVASRTGLRMTDRVAIDADHRRALADSDARLARLHARMINEQMAAVAAPRLRAKPLVKKQIALPDKNTRKRQSIQAEWESFIQRKSLRPSSAILSGLLADRAQQQPSERSKVTVEQKPSRSASPKPHLARPPPSKIGQSAEPQSTPAIGPSQAIPAPTPDLQRSEAALQNLLRIVEILEHANPTERQPNALTAAPRSPQPTSPESPPPPPPPPLPPPPCRPLLQLAPGLVARLRAERRALRAAQSTALGGWSDSPVDTDEDGHDDHSPPAKTYAGPDPWVALDEITQALLDEATDTVGAEIHALADEFVERLFDEEFLPAPPASGG